MINIPKGTKDILPRDSFRWQKVREAAQKTARRFNIKEIITPVFEHTELFVRGVGKGSDIVNKEMYTFLDKGNRSITLKPEGTAGVARSFIENGLFNDTLPLKMYYITNCFRYEKPQEGRLRQHTQFGVELYGSDSVESDVEILQIALDFYKNFGVEPSVVINNLGCEGCKHNFVKQLQEFYKPHLKDMCPDCNNRYKNNPLRILDCKVAECKEVSKNAPKMSDFLCEGCKVRFANFKKLLESAGIKYTQSDTLVRGLDYYTGFVFEFVDHKGFTLSGGGRYNNLIEELGGKPTPVVGFGIGVERLLMYLQQIGKDITEDNKLDVYILSLADNSEEIISLAKLLRENDISVETDLLHRSMKAQLKYANKTECKYVIFVGDDEIAKKEYVIKNMFTGEQQSIKKDKIVDFIKK